MDLIDIVSTVVSFSVVAIPAVLVIAKKLGKVAKETGEMLVAVSLALEDGKVTGDEVRKIIKEAKDVGKAVMDIRSKTTE